jgi:hypothetical protein
LKKDLELADSLFIRTAQMASPIDSSFQITPLNGPQLQPQVQSTSQSPAPEEQPIEINPAVPVAEEITSADLQQKTIEAEIKDSDSSSDRGNILNVIA